MKITNDELYNSINPSIQKLIQVKLPVRVYVGISNLTDAVQEKVTKFENVRNSLISQYGELDLKTQRPSIDPSSKNWGVFFPEYSELLEIEVELPDVEIIIPAYVNGHDVEIEPDVLRRLGKFVKVA